MDNSKVKRGKIPSDNKFLEDISKINITFAQEENLKDILFCYMHENCVNHAKNNRLEKYIIFTSSFQINIINKCSQIFFYGTFKMSPLDIIKY